MKRIAALGLVATLLFTAAPAQAAVKEVNAGVNAVAWDADYVWDGEHFARCDVLVDDFGDDPRVDLWCDGDAGYGTAWVRVRVSAVRGKVTRVRAELTGDCSNRNVSWKKQRSKVLVTVSIHADTNCEVRAIRVRYAQREDALDAVKVIVTPCQIHRGCTIEVRFGDAAGGRIPWPDPDLKPDAQRDFPGSVPIQLRHFSKDGRANVREGITEFTAELAELREETKKLARLVARFRDDELVQALRAKRW